MAQAKGLTLKIETQTEEIGTMKPIGSKNVSKSIKSIGQYIIDNADKISENIDKTVEINISANISIDELPTVEISYTNRIFDTSMINTATTE